MPNNFNEIDGEWELLARKSQNGDGQAYAQLMKALYPYVHRLVSQRLGGVVEADDITQECLLGVHRSLPSFLPGRKFKPWLFAILRYKTMDYFRKLARLSREVQNEQILDVTPGTVGTNEQNEGSSASVATVELRDMLLQLPESLRRAITRTKLEGKTYKEVSQEEGISEAALRKRISRAYKQLGSLMSRRLGENIGA